MQNPAAAQVTKIIKEANNVLVTVRNSPSVDELSAAIALTLMLNHLNKHAITVFSGRVPSTIEFLQPEMAIDTNTDSLRDFIIALDKSKADKLRYKVEDNVVRIFITPYKTTLSDKDLEFSQGDFNVDVVVALGVVDKEDFDQAVTLHGRILHDATVVTLTKKDRISQLGAINWQEQTASSISEMITSIADNIGGSVIDGQIATALLTGIVSETDRFRNANTTPQVMSLSSKLMAAGANQQLIAEKLEEPDTGLNMKPLTEESASDGTLEIEHEDSEDVSKIHIDDSGNLQIPTEEPESDLTGAAPSDMFADTEPVEAPSDTASRSYIEGPSQPKLFGQDDSGTVTAQPLLSADQPPAPNDPNALDEFMLPPSQISSSRIKTLEPLAPAEPEVAISAPPVLMPPEMLTPATPAVAEPLTPSYVSDQPVVPAQDQTLTDLEKAVESAHAQATPEVDAQPSVEDFLGTTRPIAEPDEEKPAEPERTPAEQPKPEEEKKEPPKPPVEPFSQPAPQVINPNAPPAVPPPLMPQAGSQPQFYEADGSNNNPFLNPS